MKSAEDQGQTAGDRAGTAWPGVSVVMPVLNEERHLESAIGRVLDQEYPGELEVIIAVGPSSDRTPEIAAGLAAVDSRIRVVDNPAARTPAALNLGIAAAEHEIIVRVDGHGELTDGYIKRAVELLDETGAANVGGVMDAQGTTPFEEAVAAAYTTRLGLGGGAFHLADSPAAEAETVFLGVFRKRCAGFRGRLRREHASRTGLGAELPLAEQWPQDLVLPGATRDLPPEINTSRTGEADV